MLNKDTISQRALAALAASRPPVIVLHLLILQLCLFSLSATAQTVSQRDMQVRRSDPARQWPDGRRRFALIIGVNDYQNADVTDLEGAANDARDLELALTRHAGFPRENVTTLISDRTANQWVESLPTKANILERLSNILDTAKFRGSDSLVLVAFSGHGMVRTRQQQKEAFLLPMDGFINRLESTAIRLSDIRDEVERSGVEQVMVIIDACRSNPEAGKGANDNPLTEAFTVGIDFQRRNDGIKAFVTLFATGLNQRAYEYYEGSRKRGYFTAALVEGLSGEAANPPRWRG